MIVFNVLIGLLAYGVMEFVAALSHRYLMHGILKEWHTSHHVNDLARPDDMVKNHGLEKNDRFFLIFAIPAIVLMVAGISYQDWTLLSISIGITFYGLTYFLVHDIIYHKRISVPFIQKSPNKYLRAVIRAHHAHHKPNSKGDFESYGLLIFPKRHLKES